MNETTAHYASSGLTARVLEATTDGGAAGSIDPARLARIDEFHLGGQVLTDEIVSLLEPAGPAAVLDVGCGIGGAARRFARSLHCSVTGVDLTEEFVQTARELSQLLGETQVTFEVGSALSLPIDNASQDAVTLIHVGMNIEDKEALAHEFARVLRPGGVVVIYDIMRVGPGELGYPMPWAANPESSAVAGPGEYAAALDAAGFVVQAPIDRSARVLEVVSTAGAAPASNANLGVLMGPEFPGMFANLLHAVHEGTLSPVLVLGELR